MAHRVWPALSELRASEGDLYVLVCKEHKWLLLRLDAELAVLVRFCRDEAGTLDRRLLDADAAGGTEDLLADPLIPYH